MKIRDSNFKRRSFSDADGKKCLLIEMYKLNKMEVKQKKTRAAKVTSIQLEYLIGYMGSHDAFATSKLLGARGKAAHDAIWEQLTEELNRLEGPTKNVEAWKKLWCDQRNQARSRAAKAKADKQLTGNIGNAIQLKDLDLRILSIVGGESSVGLPIMEMGFGARPEDTTDPSMELGLVANTSANKIIFMHEEHDGEETIFEGTIIQDSEETNLLSQPQASPLSQNYNEISESHIVVPIAVDPVDITQNQHAMSDNRTVSHTSTGEALTTSNIRYAASRNRKRLRTSSVEETVNSFKDVQEKHGESLQTIAAYLSRIASATEQQNELFRQFLTLQERTFTTLCKTIDGLKKK